MVLYFWEIDLNDNACYVLHSLHMPHSGTALTFVFCSSSGTHLLHNLEESVGGRSIALSRMITEKEYRF